MELQTPDGSLTTSNSEKCPALIRTSVHRQKVSEEDFSTYIDSNASTAKMSVVSIAFTYFLNGVSNAVEDPGTVDDVFC